MIETEIETIARCYGLKEEAERAIDAEAEAQRALYRAEDQLALMERNLKLYEAQAAVAAQDGKNAETRAAMAQEALAEDDRYRNAQADADALRGEVREQRVLLAVASYTRQLAIEAVRLEAARLRSIAPA